MNVQSLPSLILGLRCTLLRISLALRLPGRTPVRDLSLDLNSRAVFLVASAGAAAADAGEAAQQVRADRLDGARRGPTGQHRELPRLRRWRLEDNCQGERAHPSSGRRCRF